MPEFPVLQIPAVYVAKRAMTTDFQPQPSGDETKLVLAEGNDRQNAPAPRAPDLSAAITIEPRPAAEALSVLSPPEKFALQKQPVQVLGLPILPVTFAETLDEVDRMIASGKPGYFITANLHYAMLSHRDPRLKSVNRDAAFLVADGFPLLWAACCKRQPLPERVTGSDLIYQLCERAAQKGHRVFFMGAAPGVAEAAANELCRRYPGLQIAGVEVPPFRQATPEEHNRLVERIRNARADLLFVALGQPKGEIWLWENCQSLGVPVGVQLGASFDFVAGTVKRAPRWVQRLHLEWAYRICSEPKRLAPRYFQDALFLAQSTLRAMFTCCRQRG